MPDCPCLAGCPFFNDRMPDHPALAGMFKKNYCLGEHTACARFMVFQALGREKVPADLYPNMQDRARAIMGG